MVTSIRLPEGASETIPRICGKNEFLYLMSRRKRNVLSSTIPMNDAVVFSRTPKDSLIDPHVLGATRVIACTRCDTTVGLDIASDSNR